MDLARRSILPILAACLVCGAVAPVPARAGGGPENVAVVVNADSWASGAVANEFIRLRKVPARNVIYLAGLKQFEKTSVEEFRQAILRPVLETIEKRGLTPQIDYVVYSSDIPTEIDISADATPEALAKFPGQTGKLVTPAGSLNGLTFFHSQVLAKDVHYAEMTANRYFRPTVLRGGKPEAQRAVGFRSSFAYGETKR